MRTLTATAALMLVLSGCRVFMAAEWQRRDRCAQSLPILRDEPERPYRIIRVLEAQDENTLAWMACAEHADALLGKGIWMVRSGPRRKDVIKGAAIRYTD